MKQTIVSILLGIVVIYLALGVFLYLKQRSFIYFPPSEFPGIPAQDFSIPGPDFPITGWLLHPEKSDAIIYFGGNAEHVAANIPEFNETFAGQSVYLVNYRGYAGSKGKPTEIDLYRDAIAVYDHLSHKHAQISVIGRSLGSGVATYIAAKKTVHKLILITPFDSAQRIAQGAFPVFPMSLLLKDKYDSLGRVQDINESTEVLILVASDDEIIPYKNSQNLISAFRLKNLDVKVLDGVSHNTISIHPQFYASMKKFFK